MNRLKNISKNELEYNQYTDYIFKRTVQKYANGVLKFLKIPWNHKHDFIRTYKLDKIKNNETVTDETIACLQLIAYTDYSESTLKILIETSRLIEQLNIDMNEKEAVLYILNVLSTNMLNETEKNKFMEERKMMINPRDEYLVSKGIEKGRLEGMEKGRLEVAKKLLEKMTIKEVSEITGLSEKQIEEL